MNKEELILIACGLLGVLFHSVAKCNSLLKDAQVSNINFNWRKDYLYKDYLGITLSVLSVGIWYYIFGEVIASYPSLSAFSRTSFVVMGVIGSYALQLLFSRSKKLIRQQIDAKTGDSPKTQL